jgi:hypothetical protein
MSDWSEICSHARGDAEYARVPLSEGVPAVAKDAFDVWFETTFRNPDGRQDHLYPWHVDELRRAWNASAELSVKIAGEYDSLAAQAIYGAVPSSIR